MDLLYTLYSSLHSTSKKSQERKLWGYKNTDKYRLEKGKKDDDEVLL